MRGFWKNLSLREFWQASYLGLFAILFACIFTIYGCENGVFNRKTCTHWLQDFSLNLLSQLFLKLVDIYNQSALPEDKLKIDSRRWDNLWGAFSIK